MARLLLALLLAGCGAAPEPEVQLRETITAMQRAAEARDAAAIAAHLAEDFAGPDGMDREQFRRYLALLWLRHREVGVTLGPLDVEMMPAHATVDFTAVVTGGSGLLPDQARAWNVHTAWRRVDDDWRLIAASWQ